MDASEMKKIICESVSKLAEKYKFDAEEAIDSLDLDKRLKKYEGKKGSKGGGGGGKKGKAGAGDGGGDGATGEEPVKKKKAPTGYLLYSAEYRASVKEELTKALGEGEKLKPQRIISEIASRWKSADQSVRDEWNAKAAAAKETSA